MNEIASNLPLVSIIVLSYNSSKTILDTLNSILSQSYTKIELIITDDCSEDNTVEIVNLFLSNHGNKFKKFNLISSEKNTGISSNINRGLEVSTGEWIKLIAADDTMLPNCIEDNVIFVMNNSCARIIQSSSLYFKEDIKPERFLYKRDVTKEFIAKNNNPVYQYHILKWAPSINAPTIFIHKSIFQQVGFYDTTIASFDDWPMWLKISRVGISFYSMDKVTICYRVSSSSFSNKDRDIKIYSNVYLKLYDFSVKYLFTEMSCFDRMVKKYEYILHLYFDKFNLNKNKLFHKTLYVLLIYPINLYTRLRIFFV